MLPIIEKVRALEINAPEFEGIKKFVDNNGGNTEAGLEGITDFLLAVTALALDLAGIFALILFLWGVFDLTFSLGNEEKITKAKATMTSALIGLVIIAFARTIMLFLQNLLNIPA